MLAGFTVTQEAYRSVRAALMAAELYRSTRDRARWSGFWSWLTRRPQSLLDLATIEAECRVRSHHRYPGTRTVSVRDVRGSEGRCRDFDAEFRPRQSRTRSRWVSIAAAWLMESALPPVELIQVGDMYFVRDGHHRISVARAMGQENIEAQVTVWEVVGPLPWEKPTALHRPLPLGNLAGQPA